MIPPALYSFFGVEHLRTRGSLRVTLLYHSIRNIAYLFRDFPGDAGVRLSWYTAKIVFPVTPPNHNKNNS